MSTVPLPDGLVEAFQAYEQALADDDLVTLDRLFAPGPATLRGDADGLLVGHDAISAFRAVRGATTPRVVVQTHVQVVDEDHALVVAVTERSRGGRGQQTQLWSRGPDGWQVTAAYVSAAAPALDTRIWRVVGSPLVAGSPGPLSGQTLAVKDLYAVAGQRVGAGNPAWLAAAPVETRSATAVQSLLDAGADVLGIAQTDEFAYSLAGTNAHWGTPPNPQAAYRVPGGSSSGSATAVSLGHATIGLGTDTGGSIRVPSAYQGLFGIRTTHGLLPRSGLLALAPSFDTIGWLTRDADLLQAVGQVLLPTDESAARGGRTAVVVPTLQALADPDVAAAVHDVAAGWDGDVREAGWDLSDLPAWRQAFSTWQAWEAWQERGPWLRERLPTLGADVRARFEAARAVSVEQAYAARSLLDSARQQILDLLGDDVLLMPSASSAAPPLDGDLGAARESTLRLTCLAGIAGLPAVSVPRRTSTGLPCGVCLVAAPGRDRDLLRLAAEPLAGRPRSR